MYNLDDPKIRYTRNWHACHALTHCNHRKVEWPRIQGYTISIDHYLYYLQLGLWLYAEYVTHCDVVLLIPTTDHLEYNSAAYETPIRHSWRIHNIGRRLSAHPLAAPHNLYTICKIMDLLKRKMTFYLHSIQINGHKMFFWSIYFYFESLSLDLVSSPTVLCQVDIFFSFPQI